MRILFSKDYESMCALAAQMIAGQVMRKPGSVLGLATGSSPIGLYRRLVGRYREGKLSFARCVSVNLDEYCGLSADHVQSYACFMKRHLFGHIDIPPENTHIPNGLNENAEEECAAYDALIDALGGIDLQLLGIGRNGHIGFNEPGESFPVGTRRVALTESTIKANSKFFGDETAVPKYAYTMGIRPIVQARQVLLIASGIGKAKILHRALFGPVTPRVPASILQLVPKLTICADAGALSVVAQKHPRAVEGL